MKKLYYLGQPGDGFGWGVANTNLVRELGKLCECVVSVPQDRFDAPVLVPVVDHSLKPLAKFKAPRTIGYCFTEWPLTDEAKRNSRFYDVLFAGSEWNTQRLRERGIKNAFTLCQGVDFERFQAQPVSDRKGFVVFSGGKYEFRKGQDYVLAAMRHFMTRREDVVLLVAWHNPWTQSIQSMTKSWLIDACDPMLGMPKDRIINLPPMPNDQMPGIYKLAHVGLFPNRCEAGTNLVMSEFMACARPVIASYAHGHRDVLNGPGPLWLENGSYDPAGWFNPSVSDIMSSLEWCYQNRDDLAIRGANCRKLIEPFTWKACAEKIYAAAFP